MNCRLFKALSGLSKTAALMIAIGSESVLQQMSTAQACFIGTRALQMKIGPFVATRIAPPLSERLSPPIVQGLGRT